MRAFLLLLLCPMLGWAGDLSGIVKYGENVEAKHDLGRFGTLSLVRKDDNQLHWQIAWKPDKTTERSITSGEGIGPDEQSAYFWQEGTNTLWYCTPRVVVKLTLVDDSSSNSLHRPTKSYQKYADLPPQFRADIQKIRGEESPAKG